MSKSNSKSDNQNRERVLTKALLNLAEHYELKGKDLSEIIGMSEASATRLSQGTKFISDTSKEGELALLLIRLYRSLNAMVGDDPEKAKTWLRSHNYYLSAIPLERIKRVDGLVDVVSYLDAMRSKL